MLGRGGGVGADWAARGELGEKMVNDILIIKS